MSVPAKNEGTQQGRYAGTAASGVELRVFMPVLNVPFRLIWAKNIYRDSFQPAQGFRFSVGTTF